MYLHVFAKWFLVFRVAGNASFKRYCFHFIVLLAIISGLAGCSAEETSENQPPQVDVGNELRIAADSNQNNQSTTPAKTFFALSNDEVIASDPDGSIISYHWEQISGPTATIDPDDVRTLFGWFFPEADNNEIVLRLTVVDNEGSSAHDDVTIIYGGNLPPIDGGNQPPIVNAGSNKRIPADVNSGSTTTEVFFIIDDASASDTDGSISSYYWEQISGPTATLDNNDEIVVSGSFIAEGGNDKIELRLTVVDDQGASTYDQVFIEYSSDTSQRVDCESAPGSSNAPGALSVDAGPDIIASIGDRVDLIATASNVNGDIVSAQWRRVEGISLGVPLQDATSVNANFIATSIIGITGLQERIYEVFVQDSANNTAVDCVAVTIDYGGNETPTNVVPTVDAGPGQTVFENTPVTLTGSANDSDGTIASITWSQIGSPAVVLSNPNALTTTFTSPAVTTETVLTFRLTVADNLGASQSALVNITVQPVAVAVNVPPTVSAGAGQTVDENTTVTLIGSANDSDGTIASIAWSQIGTPSVSLSSPNSLTTTFTSPAVTADTLLTFRLTATDNLGASQSAQVTITVRPAAIPINMPPSVNAGADQTVNENTPVTLIGNATDSDGTIASIAWSQIGTPSVSLSSPNSLITTFTSPAVAVETTLSFRLTVTDNLGASQSDLVDVIIQPVNEVPTVFAGADQMADENTVVTLFGNATDSDGTITSIAWTQVGTPAVVLSNPNALTTTFTSPAVTADTVLSFRLTVTDNLGASQSDLINVTVQPVNDVPTVIAGNDQTVDENTSVTLTGSATDSDGTIASIVWSQVGVPAVVLSNPNALTTTFTSPDVTTDTLLTFRLTATDNLGASESALVNITVRPVVVPINEPPNVFAGNDQTVDENTSVTLTGNATDSDGTIASIVWSQVGVPVVVLSNPNALTTTFTSPVVATDTVLSFRLTVTDNLGASQSDLVDVLVQPANVAPTVFAGDDQIVSEQSVVNLIGTAADSDGTIASIAWSQIGVPTVTLINANTLSPSFTSPVVAVETSLSFVLTVTDNESATGSDTVNIIVRPLSTLSGAISTSAGHSIDSDVNNPNDPLSSNNSLALAQVIDSPGFIGGYVNLPNQGNNGRSFAMGDIDDYYFMALVANQRLSLFTGDTSTSSNDLDLYLYDSTGAQLNASVAPGGTTELITVADAGDYYIRVTAASGASNYVLTVDSTAGAAVVSNGWSSEDDFIAGEMIVKLAASSVAATDVVATDRRLAAFAAASSKRVTRKAGQPDRSMLLSIDNGSAISAATVTDSVSRLSASSEEKLQTLLSIKAFIKDNAVEHVSPNYIFRTSAVPDDVNYLLQWHYPLINLEQAWDLTNGDANVVVAVIDSGILPGHPDLAGKLVPGYDFISNNSTANDAQPGIDNDPTDTGDGLNVRRSSFHGTHVAGTIAAATNNSIGVAGVGWNVKVMPLRALGVGNTAGSSVGSSYDIEQALYYAAGLANDSGITLAEPVDVVNMSFGGQAVGGGGVPRPTDAYVRARAAGVILIAAAGNDGTNTASIPAAYDGVVSVSAVDANRRLASYSNFGPTIDVTAPGGSSGALVLSTSADDTGPSLVYNYSSKAGTSMSSPHVAGVAALMKSVYPGLTPDEFDAMLTAGQLTDDLGVAGRDNSFGYGLINAFKAVEAAIIASGGLPPLLLTTPTSLDFGSTTTSLSLTLQNGGSGNLIINNISQDSSGWLTVTASSVDANGLGAYDVSVDRQGLAGSNYSASITVDSNGGSVVIPVSMRVLNPSMPESAGYQIIQLLDASSDVLLDQVPSRSETGQYTFSFSNVPIGVYRIRSSSDIDHDGLYCELGESCGLYREIFGESSISVDGNISNINNLDFEAGFQLTPPMP